MPLLSRTIIQLAERLGRYRVDRFLIALELVRVLWFFILNAEKITLLLLKLREST